MTCLTHRPCTVDINTVGIRHWKARSNYLDTFTHISTSYSRRLNSTYCWEVNSFGLGPLYPLIVYLVDFPRWVATLTDGSVMHGLGFPMIGLRASTLIPDIGYLVSVITETDYWTPDGEYEVIWNSWMNDSAELESYEEAVLGGDSDDSMTHNIV